MENKILIVGPIIIDDKSSGGEGEKLYQSFKSEGIEVYKVSGYRNKIFRLFHTVFYLIFNNRKYSQIILMVFSGRAFFLETVALIISKVFRKKVIAVIHGGAFKEFYLRNQRWCKKFLKSCEIIATPSKMIQDFLNKECHQVDYLPNFIDNKIFNIESRELPKNKILWVRAFHEIYNPELIIDVMRILRDRNSEIHLTMIGPDKGMLTKCRQLISEYKLEQNINIIGFVPNEDLPNYYKEHSVFVNTTRYESFGVCLVEAASCGLPIVSVRVGEIPFVWEHNINIKLSERDSLAFSTEVLEILENVELSNMLSQNASNLVKQYTWQGVSAKWLEVLEK